jgi:adenylate cyclase class 2
MVEVEMKFAIEDFAPVEKRVTEWGGVVTGERKETDHYFNAPDRDFSQTDEALRLRRIGSSNFVTYKGPKRDSQTKTRSEVEVPLGAGDGVARDFAELMQRLGYSPVATVHKRRRIFNLDREGFRLEVCLDEVEELGRFVELEILAPEEQLDAARAVLQQSARALSLTDSERRSYLELLLGKRSKASS